MKRVKGTFNGSAVVLQESVDLPPNTEVEVLIPEREEQCLTAVLERVDRASPGEVLSLEEITQLVHQVRAGQR